MDSTKENSKEDSREDGKEERDVPSDLRSKRRPGTDLDLLDVITAQSSGIGFSAMLPPICLPIIAAGCMGIGGYKVFIHHVPRCSCRPVFNIEKHLHFFLFS